MSRTVEFGRNAGIYDRRHGQRLTESQMDRLLDAASLTLPAQVLDVAAGTGRVCGPFAERGFRVVAADRSAEMLSELRSKWGSAGIGTVRGDATRLPVASQSMDAVVVARLLYLIPDWRSVLREAARVLRGPAVILHEWANGSPDEPWVKIRERIRSLFEERGVREPFHPGARSEDEIDSFLMGLGAVATRVDLGSSAIAMAPRDFLRRIFEGEFSYTWDVPARIVEECRRVIDPWAVETFENLDEPAPFPREISWRVYRL